MQRQRPTCHHYCNSIACPECVRRFYQWAQSWTHGRKGAEGPQFYDHVRGPQIAPTKGT